MPRNETYIGDGVYASFDAFMIWLRTALGPDVFNELADYARRCWAIPDPRATA